MKKTSQDSNKIMLRTTSPAATATRKCRVCLQQGSIPISSKNSPLDFPLSHYLKLICSVDITSNDTYPKYLCKSCSNALNVAIKLRKTAIKSQLKLKSISLTRQNIASFKEMNLISVPLTILSPLQKKEKNNESNTVELKSCSPLQTEEIESNFDDTDQTDYLEPPIMPTLQNNAVNQELKEPSLLQTNKINQELTTNQTECNSIAPSVTLELVEKFKAKDIPYSTFYEKLHTGSNNQNYQCRICKKIYKKCSLINHLVLHVQGPVTQHICEVCGKTFKNFCSYYSHRIIHKTELPFQCKLCQYKGRSKSLLQVHVKRVHKKEYKYQCTLCPRKFLDTNNLRYHMRRHGEPTFPCNTCQKAFYEIGVLRRHVESQHMNMEPIKCASCGNLYKNRKNLLSHQIKVHKRKQVYNNRATYLKLESAENKLES